MKEEIREQLSALVDDELTDLERPLLLGRLQRDADLRACMGRYQLIGDVLRGGVTQATGLGIASRVQAALQDTEATQARLESAEESPSRPLWKPVMGVAIAASVALVAVLSLQNIQQAPQDTPVVARTASDTTPPRVAQVNEAAQWDRIEPQVEQRLNGYLVNHNEFAASRGMQGVTPYVRIVGFEDTQ